MGATYQDLVDLQLPDWQIGEIIEGRLMVRRPGNVLGFSALLWMVGSERRRLGWQILPRVEICLGADVLVPDISGWRYETMPVILNVPWIEIAPQWVCDLRTPETESVVRAKDGVYAKHGIGHRWILDPLQQTLEAYQVEPNGWHLIATHGENEVARIAPFEDIEIELALLWGAPPS